MGGGGHFGDMWVPMFVHGYTGIWVRKCTPFLYCDIALIFLVIVSKLFNLLIYTSLFNFF